MRLRPAWITPDLLKRRWRRVLVVVVGVPALLLAIVTGVFVAIDYQCIRSSDGLVQRLVGRFQDDVAHSRFTDACTLLSPHARRRLMRAAGQGSCAGALEARPLPVGGRIVAERTNSDDSQGVVRTGEAVYRLGKPGDAGCPAWRITGVRGIAG